jgi:hypothetical protein
MLSCKKESIKETEQLVALSDIESVSRSYNIKIDNINVSAFQGVSFQELNSFFLSIKMYKLLANRSTLASEFIDLSQKMEEDIKNKSLVEYGIDKVFIDFVNSNRTTVSSELVKKELFKKIPANLVAFATTNSRTNGIFVAVNSVAPPLPEVIVTGYIPSNTGGIDYATWQSLLSLLQLPDSGINTTPLPGTSGGGGGSSAPPSGYSQSSGGGLKCASFAFVSTASNWQEAGVSGLQLVGDWFGPFNGFTIKAYGDVFVGIPRVLQNGKIITPGAAATASAQAANLAAEIQMAKYFGMNIRDFEAIPQSFIASEFRSLMEGFLSNLIGGSCRVARLATSTKTVTKSADWNSSGSCN